VLVLVVVGAGVILMVSAVDGISSCESCESCLTPVVMGDIRKPGTVGRHCRSTGGAGGLPEEAFEAPDTLRSRVSPA
jgi:hypothetical protein